MHISHFRVHKYGCLEPELEPLPENGQHRWFEIFDCKLKQIHTDDHNL